MKLSKTAWLILGIGIFVIALGCLYMLYSQQAGEQEQNAGYWVSRDAQMAQDIVTGDDPATPGVTEFLTLTWADWDSNDVYTVIYNLVDNKLQREHYTNKDGSPPDATAFLAQYINPDQTSCVWDDSAGTLTFTVTATVEEQSETRIYEVVPRPGS